MTNFLNLFGVLSSSQEHSATAEVVDPINQYAAMCRAAQVIAHSGQRYYSMMVASTIESKPTVVPTVDIAPVPAPAELHIVTPQPETMPLSTEQLSQADAARRLVDQAHAAREL